MAVTPNYGWPVPVATDYVKDGWEAISDLGNAIDTTVAGLGSGLNFITSATLSAQTSVNVNDCFNSTYENYLIIWNISSASASDLGFRYRASGSDMATNYSNGNISISLGTGAVANYGSATTTYQIIGAISTNKIAGRVQVNNPNQTGAKVQKFDTYGYSATYLGGGLNTTSTAATGFTIFSTATTNLTGTVRVYGYENS